ncbi:tRNA (adenosine(37)-N6)-threonylcarbamoyltransferase complex dimerization subunit type 1 TsaB [bacterium]|nr:tRNA (adenosine(37)-N6)-threonylcarbamoyltransferase complex dimerization subunit type 1 TsaB [bacterium]
MRLLAIDTSTDICGVALSESDRLVADFRLNQKNVHNERLVSAIQNLVESVSWRLEELEGIALTVGPGSFTGLRIGMSVAKGLAFCLQIPIAGVNTLEAMAATVDFWTGMICTLIKARNHEVYFAAYEKRGNELQRHSGNEIIQVENVSDLIPEDALILCHPQDLVEKISAQNIVSYSNRPVLTPFSVAKLGFEKLRGGQTEDLQSVEPFYLKDFEPKKKI